jgi:hypothetical protein
MILDKSTTENTEFDTIVNDVLEANLNGICYIKQRGDIFLQNLRKIVIETNAEDKRNQNKQAMVCLKFHAIDVYKKTVKFLKLRKEFTNPV